MYKILREINNEC